MAHEHPDLADRITRLEKALAAVCEMLTTTNPHIESMLLDVADLVTSKRDI